MIATTGQPFAVEVRSDRPFVTPTSGTILEETVQAVVGQMVGNKLLTDL
jgi:hypothetical protein